MPYCDYGILPSILQTLNCLLILRRGVFAFGELFKNRNVAIRGFIERLLEGNHIS